MSYKPYCVITTIENGEWETIDQNTSKAMNMVKEAMLEEGGMEQEGGKVKLCFDTKKEAEDACNRLREKFGNPNFFDVI